MIKGTSAGLCFWLGSNKFDFNCEHCLKKKKQSLEPKYFLSLVVKIYFLGKIGNSYSSPVPYEIQ